MTFPSWTLPLIAVLHLSASAAPAYATPKCPKGHVPLPRGVKVFGVDLNEPAPVEDQEGCIEDSPKPNEVAIRVTDADNNTRGVTNSDYLNDATREDKHEAKKEHEDAAAKVSRETGQSGDVCGHVETAEDITPVLAALPPHPAAPATTPGNPASTAVGALEPVTPPTTTVALPTPVTPTQGVEPAVGTVPVQNPANPFDETLNTANAAANSAVGNDLVNNSIQAGSRVERDATDDYVTLALPYRNATVPQIKERLVRSRESLSQDVQALTEARGGLIPAERARFTKLFTNAKDKTEFGIHAIEEDEQREKTLGAISPFKSVLSPQAIANPLAKSAALADIFGTELPPGKATAVDTLVNKLVMMGGLTQPEKKQARKVLHFAESPVLALPSGRSYPLTIVHNGYILGGGKTGIDCSSFVSSVLPAEIRKSQFTTLDFATMWNYLQKGKIAKPPIYEKKRQELIQKTAGAFIPINLYRGHLLRAGDLLVYRLPWEATGHIFIIRDYNDPNKLAKTVEFASSQSSYTEREFPVSLDPPTRAERRIRPGLMVLRLKPVSNSGCRYDDHAKKGKI